MTNPDWQMREIRRRLGDYSAKDIVEERRKLIECWREAHPEAANEPASHQHPLMQFEEGKQPDNAENPDRWSNDIYIVTVRRWSDDRVFGTGGGMIQIGINTHDGTARHDWRDFQAIKNQIAGPECEAFELYPAESRLFDPSNYFTLWCFPGLKYIKVGHRERHVLNADEALAPQRHFS